MVVFVHDLTQIAQRESCHAFVLLFSACSQRDAKKGSVLLHTPLKVCLREI